MNNEVVAREVGQVVVYIIVYFLSAATLFSFAVPIDFSVRGAHFKEHNSLNELLMRADEEMYKEKYKDLPHERNSFE